MINHCNILLKCDCEVSPFRNLSAELPDPADFFSFEFFDALVPLGAPDPWFSRMAGNDGCTSLISQDDADDCALRRAEEQVWDTWPEDGRGGPAIPIFGNNQTQCSFACPEGDDPFIYTVPAGTVIARSQEEADVIAASLCEFRGFQQKVCVPTKKPPAIAPPIAWWKMEEFGDDQTPRIDIINGLKWGGPGNGSVFPPGVETVSQAPGKVNQGMRINGSGQGYMGNIVPYNGSVMDITLWVKLSSISGSYRYSIFQMTWNNGGANAYELRYRSDTGAYDLIYGGLNIILSPPFFGTGTWHFLRLLFDGINLRMSYQLDNGAILSAALPGGSVNPPAAPNNALFNLMNVQSGGPGTGDASFDEFAIWDRQLTQPELDILYNNGNGVTWPIT